MKSLLWRIITSSREGKTKATSEICSPLNRAYSTKLKRATYVHSLYMIRSIQNHPAGQNKHKGRRERSERHKMLAFERLSATVTNSNGAHTRRWHLVGSCKRSASFVSREGGILRHSAKRACTVDHVGTYYIHELHTLNPHSLFHTHSRVANLVGEPAHYFLS